MHGVAAGDTGPEKDQVLSIEDLKDLVLNPKP